MFRSTSSHAVLAPQLVILMTTAIFLVAFPNHVSASCRAKTLVAKDISFCKDYISDSTAFGIYEHAFYGDAEAKEKYDSLTGKSADCLAYAKNAICATVTTPCERTDLLGVYVCDEMCSSIDTWCGKGTYAALGYSPIKAPFSRSGNYCPFKDWAPSAAASSTPAPAASSTPAASASATPNTAASSPAASVAPSPSPSNGTSANVTGSDDSSAASTAAPLAFATAVAIASLF